MRATVMYGAGDVRVENVPDAQIIKPTDALAREFGATDVVGERGDEAIERVRELTNGFGAHSVLECVGTEQATLTAVSITRPGGATGRRSEEDGS